MQVLRVASQNEQKQADVNKSKMTPIQKQKVGRGTKVIDCTSAPIKQGDLAALHSSFCSSVLLSSFCYMELASEIPLAGGSFSYLRVELGYLAASARWHGGPRNRAYRQPTTRGGRLRRV
jgi:hypothetical protein